MSENQFNYNIEFQLKLITSLYSDKIFFLSLVDSMQEEYFTNNAAKWYFVTMRDYYKKYKSLPTGDVLKNEINKVENESLKILVTEALFKITEFFKSKDLQYVKDDARKFCKEQAVKIALISAATKVKTIENFHDFEAVKRELDKAFLVGEDISSGYSYQANPMERYSEAFKRKPIPTGFDIIDKNNLGGGLGPGELGVIMAGSGIGKSWVLTFIGLNAILSGKTVIHYTLELDESYTMKRYDVCLLKQTSSEIQQNLELLVTASESIKGQLHIKHFPARTLSVLGLKANIEKSIMLDNRPDLIILDYADLMKMTNSNDKTTQLEDLYIDLRSLADELRIPIWTASQTNREGYKSDVAKGDNVSAAFAKIFTADFVMSFNRSENDKVSNLGKAHIIKSRFGEDGNTYMCDVDFKYGMLTMLDPSVSKYNGNKISTETFDKQEVVDSFKKFKEQKLNF